MAPEALLYFNTNGDVRSCCMNESYAIGNVGKVRLPEIWAGQRRANLVDALRVGDYSLGCHSCDWQASNEGEDSSYARQFDKFAPEVAAMAVDDRWPLRLEFNLSNSCNLQCIQCHGALSSSIRIHREKLPPLPKVYDEQFFTDLVPFLRHARDIQVAGGEPFLGAETLRLWDLLAEHAPHARCNVVTNGTQWNRRVEQILDDVPMSITISIDGISKGVYESIRVGSNFDEVLVNIDRFLDYSARVGTQMTFNHCLMVQNYHEFGDLLLFAEARGILVNVNVVYRPVECSLGDLDADALGRVCDELEALSPSVLPQLELNAKTWTDELDRLRQWWRFRADDPEHQTLQAGSVPVYILGLPQWGSGPNDDQPALDRLRRDAPGGVVHTLTVGVGDVVVGCTPGAEAVFGVPSGELVGVTGADLQERLTERLGAIAGAEVLGESDDHVDQVITYGSTPFRAVAVALRDDRGKADEVRLMFVAPGAAD